MGLRIKSEGLKEVGFTLVELAIALMVIGLLIGGVLKGQELIENARITRTIKDLKDFDTAVMIFRNTYNALPGDMKNAERVPNCNDGVCNEVLTINGDNFINANETVMFWLQLQRAGMITGVDEYFAMTATGYDRYSVSPLNPFGYHYIAHATYGVTNLSATIAEQGLRYNRLFVTDMRPSGIDSDRLTLKRAIRLDEKADDGKPLTGWMRIVQDGLTAWGSGTVCNTGDLDWERTRSYCHLGAILSSMN